jgi:hypothetical protein
MVYLFFVLLLLLSGGNGINALATPAPIRRSYRSSVLHVSLQATIPIATLCTLQCAFPIIAMADASVSEEDVLSVVGQVSALPDPVWVVGVAAFLAVGVAALQYSLGDINKAVGKLVQQLCTRYVLYL